MWELPETPEVIRAGATLLGAAAAFWGAFIAHSGLGTWRKERDSELAKRLATNVFQHRKELRKILTPYVTSEEIESFSENQALDSRLYKYRWQKAYAAYEELQPLLAEGDLRWNDIPTSLYSNVINVSDEISRKILRFGVLAHRNQRSSFSSDPVLQREFYDLEDQLQAYPNQESTLRNEIDTAFNGIIALLKEKI